MEEDVYKYIDNLIEECLNSPYFVNLTPDQLQEQRLKLTEYFQELIFNTLVDNLTDEQVEYLNTLDLESEETNQTISALAAQVPNFVFILDEKLKVSQQQIIQTGQIPQVESLT